MPAITPESTVLVTGANGFIAAHCIRHLLSAGFHVKGTVRDMSKAGSVFAAHNQYVGPSSLEIIQVSDLCDTDQWTEALKGCDAVMHLASTFRYDVLPSEFESQLLLPAVNGTTALLEAAAKKEARVARVMIMSSFAAVYDASKGPQPEKVYTDADWCPITWEEGVNSAAVPVAYRASKALAEKAAWDFMKEKAPDFDLVTLCPGMVFGSLMQPIRSLKTLNTSNQIVWDVVSGENREIPPTKAPVFTDVSDLAEASLQSLVLPEASGQRYLLATGSYDTQEIADIVRAAMPEHRSLIPIGEPGKRLASTHFSIDNSKARRELGVEFSALETSVVPLLRQLYRMQAEETAGLGSVMQQSVL